MADLNYLVLYSNGEVGAIHIGDVDDEELFSKLIAIFKTSAGPICDNYVCRTMSTCSAHDISLLQKSGVRDDVVADFSSKLNGHGFEIFACWHQYGKALYQAGVYEKNEFLSGFDVYGPLVIRAQVDQDETDPVEVPASTALYLAEKIFKAKGVSVDTIFNG